MKLRTTVLALALTSIATFATADHLKGVVVRLEPGKYMVVRGPDLKEVTYTFGPTLTVPTGVVVGRNIEFDTEQGTGDTWVVTRVTTTTNPDGSMERTTERTTTTPSGDKYITVTGEVIRYEPGRTIVLREPNRKEVTFTLAPDIVIPEDVRIGRRVTLFTEAGEGGATLVKRVTTTSMTPEGDVKRTTEETRTSPSGTLTTSRTTINGVVQTYDAGKSITLTRPDGSTVTYVINDRSQIPADLVVGKRVVIRTVPLTGSNDLAVERVTYTTTKTKSKTDKHGKTETETKTKTEHEH
jgi:acetyltransferase-like isoleucine patch superfamily enzyme